MRHLVSMLAGLLLLLTPAAAAERKLLAPHGLQATVSATAGARAGLQALRMKSAAGNGKVRVIVGLRVPFAAESALMASERTAQRRDIAKATGGFRQRFATTIARDPQAVRSYSTLPFVAMDVTAGELDRLASDPQVITISEDRPNRTNLAESAPVAGAPPAWAAGFTGAGQTIAIIDTGVDKTHPFLAGKVVAEACFSQRYCPGRTSASVAPGSGMPCASRKACQHGTHVAGIAAGKNGSFGGVTFSGIAPDATLISVMVFSRQGSSITAWDSDILAGLEHVYELRNTFRIAAVNLSLGGGRYYSYCDAEEPVFKAMFDQLRGAGIAPVVSSGNDGWTESLEAPACISSAVSVGAVSDTDWGTCWDQPTAVDKVTCYANTARFLSLLAPGSPITSSVPGGRYETWHGTSMAAPHVAGAFAVLKQAAPMATVDGLEAALVSSGKAVTDDRETGASPPATTPRIDVGAALGQFRLLQVGRSNSLGLIDVIANGSTLTCRTPSCTIRLAPGTAVRLTARPAEQITFSAWTGASCTGAGATCDFVMPDADAAATAVFDGAYSDVTYTRAGTGSGLVRFGTTTGDYDCAGNCVSPAALTTTVTAEATPADGSLFTGWSGACEGAGACSFRAGSPSVTLSATFVPGYLLAYVKAGTGTGSVRFTTAGKDATSCSTSCTAAYDPDAMVTLTAVPGSRARFRGWSGACSGRKTCSILMSQARSVTANFTGK
jgi:subtilisin family serine protease